MARGLGLRVLYWVGYLEGRFGAVGWLTRFFARRRR